MRVQIIKSYLTELIVWRQVSRSVGGGSKIFHDFTWIWRGSTVKPGRRSTKIYSKFCFLQLGWQKWPQISETCKNTEILFTKEVQKIFNFQRFFIFSQMMIFLLMKFCKSLLFIVLDQKYFLKLLIVMGKKIAGINVKKFQHIFNSWF